MMCDYAIRRRGRSPKTNITPDKKLTYPTHPFSPTLSKILSTLPRGFADMALKTLLSNQVIRLLNRMAATIAKSPTEFVDDTSVAVEMMRLSMEPEATALENAVVQLSLVFGRLLVEVTMPGVHTRSHRTYKSMKDTMETLAKSVFTFEESAGREFVVWTVFLLVSVEEDNYGLPVPLQDDILVHLRHTVSGVDQLNTLQAMLERYFWHENLVPRMVEMWERMAAQPSSRQTESG